MFIHAVGLKYIIPLVLYECDETWSSTQWEEYRLKVYKNGKLKRILHNESKSQRMGEAHITCRMTEKQTFWSKILKKEMSGCGLQLIWLRIRFNGGLF
jgi:hypothetical protein